MQLEIWKLCQGMKCVYLQNEPNYTVYRTNRTKQITERTELQRLQNEPNYTDYRTNRTKKITERTELHRLQNEPNYTVYMLFNTRYIVIYYVNNIRK